MTAYVQQPGAARWVIETTVLAFVVGEIGSAIRRRRGTRRVSIRAEVVLRLALVGAVLWFAAAGVLVPRP